MYTLWCSPHRQTRTRAHINVWIILYYYCNVCNVCQPELKLTRVIENSDMVCV